MDSANIQDSIIGATITIIIQIINTLIGIGRDWIAGNKEVRLKQIEIDSMERQKQLEEELRQKSELKTVYQNAIRNLALIHSEKNGKVILSESELAQAIDESNKWLTDLSFYLRENFGEQLGSFDYNLRLFRDDPLDWADSLLRDIEVFSKTDPILLPSNYRSKIDESVRKVDIYLSEQYRKEQFIEGIELQPYYEVNLNIGEITSEQRKILWDIFSNFQPRPPFSFFLRMPKYNSQTKNIDYSERWYGRVNPEIQNISEIFNKWVNDFNTELKKAQQELEKGTSSNPR